MSTGFVKKKRAPDVCYNVLSGSGCSCIGGPRVDKSILRSGKLLLLLRRYFSIAIEIDTQRKMLMSLQYGERTIKISEVAFTGIMANVHFLCRTEETNDYVR